ncbi:hypothetical protein Ahia01_001028000 [Argonauta hians]
MWTRKDNQELYDLSMGSEDSAEVTDLVGIFLLNEINKKFPTLSGGAYRDDLLFITNVGPRSYNNLIKDMRALFNTFSLKLDINPETKRVDFLDVTLDLNLNIYEPYHKPNEYLQYVHRNSNHPPYVLESIPKSVAARISSLSSNADIFNKHINHYQQAINKAGHNCTLQYISDPSNHPNNNPHLNNQDTYALNNTYNIQPNNRRQYNHHPNNNEINSCYTITYNYNTNNINSQNRRYTKPKSSYKGKNVIFYHPPYNRLLKTKLGKCFFKLLDKHFPKNHKYHKIINRNTVKLSYSTTNNLKQIIDNSNSRKLGLFMENKHNLSANNNSFNRGTSNSDQENYTSNNNNTNNCNNNMDSNSTPTNPLRNCNCRNRQSCPGSPICKTKNIIYCCKVQTQSTSSLYIGQTTQQFRSRISSHLFSFRQENLRNSTSLSKLIHTYNEKGTPYSVVWSILDKAAPCVKLKQKCNLCIAETYHILKLRKDNNVLNNINETLISCPHRRNLNFTNYRTYNLPFPFNKPALRV